MIVLPSQIFHTALACWNFCLVFCYSQNMFLCWISVPSLPPNQEMTILQLIKTPQDFEITTDQKEGISRNIIKALLKRFCLSMITLGFYPDSKLWSALYRVINCQLHQKVLISSFHGQTQKLQKHNFKIKTLSLRI